MQALKMQHDTDPRADLLAAVGDLSELEDLFHNEILVAVYKRPEKTKGGIMLPDQVRKEDDYQGKVGLVLRKGPLAFVDDSRNSFAGLNVKEGDWIVFRPSDGWQLIVNKGLCRMLQDIHVKARITRPDFVF